MSRGNRLSIVLALVGSILLVRVMFAWTRIASIDDACDYLLLGWDEQTAYASEFTEAQFGKIPIGANKRDVVNRLGRPLRVSQMQYSDEIVFYYTSPKQRDGSFWLRFVVFDSTGHAIRVHRSFYVD